MDCILALAFLYIKFQQSFIYLHAKKDDSQIKTNHAAFYLVNVIVKKTDVNITQNHQESGR